MLDRFPRNVGHDVERVLCVEKTLTAIRLVGDGADRADGPSPVEIEG